MNLGKRQVVAGLAAAALLSLAACGSDDNSEPDTTGAAPSSGATTSPIDCATGSITGGGSSAQKNAMDEWVKAYQDECSGATINYQSSSSGTGRQQFIDKQVAFAGSDSALKDDQKTKADARCTGGAAVDIPMVVGPIAVIYNLDGVKDLQLKPATVAKIFSGAITKWNDPAIAADNSGASLPDAPIQSVHRSDSSGTTDNFTKFLKGAASADWTFEGGSDWKAPGGQGAKGSDGVTSTVKSTANAVGYVELSYAENAGLSTAKIGNAADEFVAVSTDGASLGISTAKVADGDDLKLTFDYATATKGAYPIYLASYEIVCTTGNDAAAAPLLKSFLTYTASEDGQAAIADLGYAPLPDSIATKVRAVIEKIA
ncbi:phosphate transport system substrate-binding protein [Parafrankia irregularis]|uniref:Phosphate-binding protein n=1 Tax=Parafrankia irregularis TaxID=795642 RepID=A0A0S4QRR8_9ACTN|nr:MULTISPECIES: phosphate ABC transporter substrate-binding protein PstS [Parafrankia]MBE3204591.1 phosphate ABC transporter substrate-binding protein PstS [Parafrankia sp. CH37]CUU58443.1 phosphate transport system substrate-binding protein [Parafrankia irregularis]